MIIELDIPQLRENFKENVSCKTSSNSMAIFIHQNRSNKRRAPIRAIMDNKSAAQQCFFLPVCFLLTSDATFGLKISQYKCL